MSLEDMEGEIWKGLPYYEDYVQISNYGRIKRLKRLIERKGGTFWLKERIVKQSLYVNPDSRGISSILSFTLKITDMGLGTIKEILRVRGITARAVYSTFIEPLSFEDDRLVIRYKDNDSLNTRLENLYIETRSNVAKKHFKKQIITPPDFYKMPEKVQYNMRNSCKKMISQFDKNGNYIQTFQGISDAARALNVDLANIASVIDKARTAYGFLWRSGSDTSPISAEMLNKYRNPHGDRSKPVNQYTQEGEPIATYKSIEDAARQIGCSSRLINMAVHGKVKTAKGFIFKFVDLAGIT